LMGISWRPAKQRTFSRINFMVIAPISAVTGVYPRTRRGSRAIAILLTPAQGHYGWPWVRSSGEPTAGARAPETVTQKGTRGGAEPTNFKLPVVSRQAAYPTILPLATSGWQKPTP
jgi:hypothetical protein